MLAHATHLVLAGEAVKKFQKSPIARIIGSDTYPDRISGELLEVYTVAPVLAETIENYLHI